MRALIILSLLLAPLALAPAASGQQPDPVPGTGTLLGHVVAGDTQAPLAGVSVEVRWAVDSTVVASSVTGEQGRFRIGQVPEGNFYLVLSSLGYATITTQPFELAYGETRDLGALPLPIEALTLDPIMVSTERNAVTFEADRTSYNVGVMAGTEGASVTEALRGIPELAIDIDGRITLRGSTPVIYIDGRPAPMDGEALALFLEQFPADYVEKIEVMANPSARYNAEGSGGIVNVVLKEGVELGVSGSVHASAGTRGQYGGGARGTVQRGDWTHNGHLFFRLNDVDRTSYDLRQNLLTDPPFIRQDSRSTRSGLYGGLGLETEWEPTDRLELSVEGRVDRSGNDALGLTTTTHMDEDEGTILRYERESDSEGRGVSGDLSAGLEYSWEPRRHELEVEVGIERGRDIDDSREEVLEDALVDGVLIPAELTIDDQSEWEVQQSLEVDYTRPWAEDGRIEVGLDLGYERTDQHRLIRLVDDPETLPEGTETDRGYDHREQVSALYLSGARELGDFGLQLGLRAEHTDLSLTVPTGDVVRNDYFDLFPSASASYRIDEDRQLRLSYSRRVQRPGASILNPVDRSTDPLTRRVGNPDIEPQFTHSISLDASQNAGEGNLHFSTYYRRTTNDWAETVTVDAEGVSIRTWQNLASQESYGASLTYSLRPVENWNGFINVSGRRQIRNASNLGDRYSGSSLVWSSRARVNGEVGMGLSLQGNFSYDPPLDLPQGRTDATYEADFGIRYRFLDRRASVRLALEDPFGLRESRTRLQDTGYILIGRSEESTRSASISVSYSFGGEGRRRGGRGWDRDD